MQAEAGNGLLGKGAAGRQIVDGGLQFRIFLAEMNGPGPRTAAQIEQPPAPDQIDLADKLGRQEHGQVEHPQQKIPSPFGIVTGIR